MGWMTLFAQSRGEEEDDEQFCFKNDAKIFYIPLKKMLKKSLTDVQQNFTPSSKALASVRLARVRAIIHLPLKKRKTDVELL